ncbi:Glycosyl transferases group 1 [Oribacterium sp. KHPX15]|uniref:glycosyltransferase family 4 protein n=1 Tax=Oribacterium sp. KHPX15 TaxID=1855342 RepID=UPI000896C706|nr:glycosyltransferase [Oribacterium sp. KHPX15]SEA83526.1 Glycosyl transferases group 1 [Oribacterium sp. KHPX15]
MKILWLCNIVLPFFAEEFHIKKNPYEGWMTGMYNAISNHEGLDIAFCMPIFDLKRLKDGILNGVRYYTFLRDIEENNEEKEKELEKRFEQIIKDFKPDIIHIWGTEYAHSLAMIKCARQLGLIERTVVYIQGMVSECAKLYLAGIPEDYKKYHVGEYPTLLDEKKAFAFKGKNEIEVLQMAQIVLGRTRWDQSCVKRINQKCTYYECREILRTVFYDHKAQWRNADKHNHRIFMSQGAYPIKGTHYVIKALAKIVENYPNTKLVLAGVNIVNEEKPYCVYLRSLISELGLEENIIGLGILQEGEMIEEYKKANVYVLPSVIENSPNSLLEAMLIGTPVVAAKVGGIDSIIRNEEEGLLYRFDDINGLANCIISIFEGRMGLERMSKSETERASSFANKSCASDLVDIYTNLCT